MAIHFDASRWEEIRKTYDLWWKGKLERPLLNIRITDAYTPEGPAPAAPLLSQANCHDLSVPARDVIDAVDYNLQKIEFLGDSFPSMGFAEFGPGVLAAFCGALLDNSSGGVWFFPEKKLPIEEIHIKYDPENKWVRRVKDLYRAGNEKWRGRVLLAMPDLGGNLDVAAAFRTSEDLLIDLYDNPGEVLRLAGEIQTAWYDAYWDLRSAAAPLNPGFSDWDGLYSAEPSYVLQSDFSYMISPDMFKTFVMPVLEKDCETLANTIYHLDGVGEIPHLDMLLSMKNLNAVQWVYGDGKPSSRHWIDLYKRIEEAGKGIHVIGGAEDFIEVYSKVKKGLYFNGSFTTKERNMTERLLAIQG